MFSLSPIIVKSIDEWIWIFSGIETNQYRPTWWSPAKWKFLDFTDLFRIRIILEKMGNGCLKQLVKQKSDSRMRVVNLRTFIVSVFVRFLNFKNGLVTLTRVSPLPQPNGGSSGGLKIDTQGSIRKTLGKVLLYLI